MIQEIIKFADIIDKVIEIRYYPNQGGRFSAHFEHCEVKSGCMLVGQYGNGKTPARAIKDYANKIKGEKIVFNAMDIKYRQEYIVPYFGRTK